MREPRRPGIFALLVGLKVEGTEVVPTRFGAVPIATVDRLQAGLTVSANVALPAGLAAWLQPRRGPQRNARRGCLSWRVCLSLPRNLGPSGPFTCQDRSDHRRDQAGEREPPPDEPPPDEPPPDELATDEARTDPASRRRACRAGTSRPATVQNSGDEATEH